MNTIREKLLTLCNPTGNLGFDTYATIGSVITTDLPTFLDNVYKVVGRRLQCVSASDSVESLIKLATFVAENNGKRREPVPVTYDVLPVINNLKDAGFVLTYMHLDPKQLHIRMHREHTSLKISWSSGNEFLVVLSNTGGEHKAQHLHLQTAINKAYAKAVDYYAQMLIEVNNPPKVCVQQDPIFVYTKIVDTIKQYKNVEPSGHDKKLAIQLIVNLTSNGLFVHPYEFSNFIGTISIMCPIIPFPSVDTPDSFVVPLELRMDYSTLANIFADCIYKAQ